MHSVSRPSLLLLLLFILLTTACHRNPEPIRLQGQAQGTYYSVIYYDSLSRQLGPQVDSILNAFDQSASLWVDSSLLRRINRNETMQTDTILAAMLRYSLWTNAYTHGAFDISVGKLVNAWGFGFENRQTMTDALIDSLRQYTGSDAISLITDSNGNTLVHKRQPETEIDLNAIAQGYVVDLIVDYLAHQGITNCIVDVGGEVLARGHKPNGDKWVVGIERPAANKYSEPEVETSIELEDLAVVTSGNYRKYYEDGGTKYAHTIDPTTGRPVDHTLLSVTVVDRYAWRADALATSFMVMGLEKALRFIDDHPDDPQVQSVFFIYNDEGDYRTFATSAFEQLIRHDQSR